MISAWDKKLQPWLFTQAVKLLVYFLKPGSSLPALNIIGSERVVSSLKEKGQFLTISCGFIVLIFINVHKPVLPQYYVNVNEKRVFCFTSNVNFLVPNQKPAAYVWAMLIFVWKKVYWISSPCFANHGLNKNGEEDAIFHIQATPSIHLENSFPIEAMACDLILQATLEKMSQGFLPGTYGGLTVLWIPVTS